MWGVLPIILKTLLDSLDGYTITWFRFSISALIMPLFILIRKKGTSLRSLNIKIFSLVFIAALSLLLNHILFVLGIRFVSPSTAAVVIQLAPMFMLIGSLIIFKEHFSLFQWLGFALLCLGLLLFFNEKAGDLFKNSGNYGFGVFLVVLAGIIWAVYALAQKQVLKILPSESIMLLIYILGSLMLLPVAQPLKALSLSGPQQVFLLLCGLNTLFAYGAFAEALDHWDASRISMVLSLTPLFTIIAMKLCALWVPGFISPERLNVISVGGAILVVIGSMICALNKVKQTT